MAVDERCAEMVAFAGETLGPLFLQDPRTGTARQLYQAFSEIDPRQAAREWPFVQAEQAEGFLALMQDGASCGCDDEALVWEYRRLLVGPQKLPAPPWGSVYTDYDQVVFGASTLALRQWMREQGIDRLDDGRDPEDHIGLLLLMMAWIARNRPQALEDFLRLHVLTWSSHFLDEFSDAAEHPFFVGLSGLTKATLEGAGRALMLEVDCPTFYR